MLLNTFLKMSLLGAALAFSVCGYAAAEETHSKAKQTTTETARTTDASIAEYIHSHIKKSKILSPLHVKVVVKEGVVTLSGKVDSESEVSALVELAESVVGVKDVQTTDLQVKDSEHPVADTIITAKVKGLLIREDLFGNKDVASVNTSVETKDGIVYLTGIVDNKEQIDNAIQIIQKNLPDVKKVIYSVNKFVSENEAVDQKNN